MLVALLLTLASQTAVVTTVTAPSTARASVELLTALSAQNPASNVDTSLTTWLGVRAGGVNTDQAGFFVGGDGALLVGVNSAGTGNINYTHFPALLEGRGLAGVRMRRGIVGLGGYGYGGAGIGGGLGTVAVFDTVDTRPFFTTTIRVGGGAETSMGPVMLRIETGAGVRDLRLEIHATVAVGLRF